MSTKELPKILFISPTFPGGHKNGLSMRAAMWLNVLQQNYEVSLLVIPVADDKAASCDLKLSKLCKKIHTACPSLPRRLAWRIQRLFNGKSYADQILSENFLQNAGKELCEIQFDAIHVLRAYLSPAVRPFVERQAKAPILTLDLDDIESITNERLAELYQKHELPKAALMHEKLSKHFAKLETEITQQFNQIFVCSDLDATGLQSKEFSRICVVPNSLPAQPKLPKAEKSSAVFSFLFVGNFQYFPNQDAINWLVSDILPVMRAKTKQVFKITLIGSGKLPNHTKLQKVPELKIIHDVPDLAPYYQNSDVVIVPIRAGGGTRIKIIEAFSFNVPVVSTTIGIEGINATHAKQALIADDAVAFANCCLELINNYSLRSSIAEHGAQLFEERYCTDIVQARTISIFGS